MPAISTTREISNEEWEDRKELIRELYLTQGRSLRGDEGVMMHLARLGFVASKSQYETRFKKWDFHKYRSKETWRGLLNQPDEVSKRPIQEIYDGVEVISAAKIRKVKARYKFEKEDTSLVVLEPDNKEATETGKASSLISSKGDSPRIFEVDGDKLLESFDQTLRQLWTTGLPFYLFESKVCEIGRRMHSSGKWPTPTNAQTIRAATETRNWNDLLFSTSKSLLNPAQLSRREWILYRKLSHGQWDIAQDLSHVDPMFKHPLSRLVLFSIANNFCGFDSIPGDKILKLFNQQQILRLIKYLNAIPGPASDALAENLLISAIEAKDCKIVKAIMERGVDANRFIQIQGFGRFTLIERSSMLQDITTTEYLISLGADPNKTDPNFLDEGGALQYTFRPSATDSCFVNVELVLKLLRAGATVTETIFMSAIRDPAREALLNALILESRTWKSCMLGRDGFSASGRIVESMFKHLDPPVISDMMIKFFGCFTDDERSSSIIQTQLSHAMNLAAGKGYIDLVQMLLLYGTEPSEHTLALAVRSGNQSLIELLIDMAPDMPREQLPRSYKPPEDPFNPPVGTPFSEAILSKNTTLKAFFESNGAFLTIQQEMKSNGSTGWGSVPRYTLFRSAIRAAIIAGDGIMFQRLLDLFIDSDAHPTHLKEHMDYAILVGQADFALILLNSGANHPPNRYQSYGPSSVALAIKMRNERLVWRLLETNPPEQEGGKFLLDALEWGNDSITEELCRIPEFQRHLDFALLGALKRNDTKSVQFLIERGADPDSKCEISSVLSAAVRTRNEELVSYLLTNGASPQDSQALAISVEYAPSLTPILLGAFSSSFPNGINSHGYGAEALAFAIMKVDYTCVEALLEAHVAVNTFCLDHLANKGRPFANAFGTMTPFGLAINQDNGIHLQLVKQLLEASGDPNSCTARGGLMGYRQTQTALCSAIETGNISMVELLLEYGAKPDQAAQKGNSRTALQKAAEMGSLDIVKLLLGLGVGANEPAAYFAGGTALQLASIKGHVAVVYELLAHGAEVHAPASNCDGRTALEGAAEHGRIDIVRVLWNSVDGQGFSTREVRRAKKFAEDNCHYATKAYVEHLFPSIEQGQIL